MTKSSKHHKQFEPVALVPALIGAGIGVLGSRSLNRRSRTYVFTAGLMGGITALAVWSTRAHVRAAVHEFRYRLDTARDLRWLARNPIDYA